MTDCLENLIQPPVTPSLARTPSTNRADLTPPPSTPSVAGTPVLSSARGGARVLMRGLSSPTFLTPVTVVRLASEPAHVEQALTPAPHSAVFEASQTRKELLNVRASLDKSNARVRNLTGKVSLLRDNLRTSIQRATIKREASRVKVRHKAFQLQRVRDERDKLTEHVKLIDTFVSESAAYLQYNHENEVQFTDEMTEMIDAKVATKRAEQDHIRIGKKRGGSITNKPQRSLKLLPGVTKNLQDSRANMSGLKTSSMKQLAQLKRPAKLERWKKEDEARAVVSSARGGTTNNARGIRSKSHDHAQRQQKTAHLRAKNRHELIVTQFDGHLISHNMNVTGSTNVLESVQSVFTLDLADKELTRYLLVIHACLKLPQPHPIDGAFFALS